MKYIATLSVVVLVVGLASGAVAQDLGGSSDRVSAPAVGSGSPISAGPPSRGCTISKDGVVAWSGCDPLDEVQMESVCKSDPTNEGIFRALARLARLDKLEGLRARRALLEGDLAAVNAQIHALTK